MNRREMLACVAGILAAPSGARRGQTASGDDLSRTKLRLQRVIDDYVATKRLSGAFASLSLKNANISVSAGNCALGSGPRFDENSICRVYSMTKPVTGCAAMLLVEDGKLLLDQPVADILPELAKPSVAIDPSKSLDARPAQRSLTIRHLLTHSGGLAYWTPEAGTDALSMAYRAQGITPGNFYPSGLARAGYGPQVTNLENMVRRLAELPLASEPGTSWRYSVGLDVMGLIIERVSGKSLDTFARERIFAPLAMETTGFRVERTAVSRLTSNYTVTPEGLKPLDPRETSVFLAAPRLIAGGAGLVTTARDFSQFGAMLLGDGQLGHGRVMKAETARAIRSNLLPKNVVYSGGGFGAGMRVAAGGPTPRDVPGAVSWNGAAGTMWLVDPARNLNFVFMSQFMPPTSYPIWDEVMAVL